MCGKEHLQRGKRKWANRREKAEKGKVAREKGKATKETWVIGSQWGSLHLIMEFATIGRGGMVIANMDQIATLNMRDQKVERGNYLLHLWLLPVRRKRRSVLIRNENLP
jgi:hypothetical protein